MLVSIIVVTLCVVSAYATYRGMLARLGPFRGVWRSIDAPFGVSIRIPYFRMPSRNDLEFTDVGRRILRTIGEVLFQSRVIRNRPIVGLLHGIVMWGFVAFSGVSLMHLWSGLTGSIAEVHFDSVYRAMVALFAMLVVLAMSALAFRRFVMRPAVLGALSTTSAIVTILIVALMVTYLMDWVQWYDPGSVGSLAVWWVHTVALIAFPPIIVRSKHLHLVLAPIAIFFRSFTTSRMRPLDVDEDGAPTELGLTRFSELSRKNLLDLQSCVECGRCTTVCPANRSGSSLDPKRIILDMQHGLARGDGRILDFVREGDLMDCTTCGACEEACPVGIQHVGMILDLRHGLVNNAELTLERVAKRLGPMKKSPYSAWPFTKTRQELVEGEAFPLFKSGMQYLLWLGCGVGYNRPEIATSMKVILDTLGVSWGVLEMEICCGETQHQLGNAAEPMLEVAPRLIETFVEQDVYCIIVCDPHCAGMMSIDHRRQNSEYADLGIEVIPHTVFIAEHMAQLRITPEAIAIAYHDPCKLGRGLDITRPPRDILHQVSSDVREPVEHGRHSTCCGAGGGQSVVLDESRPAELRMNYARFDALMDEKPDIIATACPHCPVMLADAASARGSSVPIMDIATIVAQRIQKEKS